MAQRTTIRALEPADLESIVAIDRERSARSRTEFYRRRFRNLAADPASLLGLAAEQGERVVGFAFARVLDGEFGGAAPVGVLDAVGVPAAHKREGVATALLAGLETALAGRGVRELRTQVDWTEHGMAAFFSACGFRLSSRIVLERTLERLDDELTAEEELPVRSMTERDLPAIIRLDRKVTGRDRTAYLRRKAAEVLTESAIRMSLVAELEGGFAGFLMARVDFGEFGRAEPTAVLDTIGVDPGYARRHVGRALLEQLLLNVAGLRAERVVTEVEWSDLPLLGFLGRTGFDHSQRLAFDKAIS
jgi:ribosomal protein S18 acetylase RimI-like enzyme